MRGLRGPGLLVLLAFAVGLLPTTSAFAADCESDFLTELSAGTCEDKLGWTYDPATRTFAHGSVITSATSNDPYEYSERLACDENAPDAGTNRGCTRASSCPPKLDPDGQPMRSLRIEAFRKLKANPDDPWQATNGGVCRYAGRTVPMRDVVAAARQGIEKLVGRPTIIAQPPNAVTLVNFTSLFHAPVQNVTSLMITAPVPGEITATPYYTWDLDDGIIAEGPGHAYDPRTDPKDQASDDYYVKAFYRTPGPKNVHLTLTWQVSIHLDGYGDVPLVPIVFPADTTTTAKTAHARLVAR